MNWVLNENLALQACQWILIFRSANAICHLTKLFSEHQVWDASSLHKPLLHNIQIWNIYILKLCFTESISGVLCGRIASCKFQNFRKHNSGLKSHGTVQMIFIVYRRRSSSNLLFVSVPKMKRDQTAGDISNTCFSERSCYIREWATQSPRQSKSWDGKEFWTDSLQMPIWKSKKQWHLLFH